MKLLIELLEPSHFMRLRQRQKKPFGKRLFTTLLIGLLPAAAALSAAGFLSDEALAAMPVSDAQQTEIKTEIERIDRSLPEVPVSEDPAGDAALEALLSGMGEESARRGEPPRPEASNAPGNIVLLWSPGLSTEENAVLARDAKRLGIPFVISGLPMKARRPEAIEKALKAGDIRRASPFVLDRAALQELGAFAAREGITLAAAPEVWHAVRDGLSAEPLTPALALFGERVAEVFPGSVRPLWTLAWARDHALHAEIRAQAAERIRAAGLEDEARFVRP